MTTTKKEESFGDSLTNFTKAIEKKLQSEIKNATESLKKSSKDQSKEDFAKTFKKFATALKERTIVEIDKATDKINEGLKK